MPNLMTEFAIVFVIAFAIGISVGVMATIQYYQNKEQKNEK